MIFLSLNGVIYANKILYRIKIRKTQTNFRSTNSTLIINFHGGGMTVARPYGFEIDFVRNPISGSAV